MIANNVHVNAHIREGPGDLDDGSIRLERRSIVNVFVSKQIRINSSLQSTSDGLSLLLIITVVTLVVDPRSNLLEEKSDDFERQVFSLP